MDAKWLRTKWEAYRSAWRRNYGYDPELNNVVLGLCPAAHETRCGDAWPGPDGIIGTQDDEHNWGATILRLMNEAERWTIADAGAALLVNAGLYDIERPRALEFLNAAPQWRWHLLSEDARRSLGTQDLSASERAALLPLTPTVRQGHPVRAAEAYRVLRAAGHSPAAVIHCDSSAENGPYFVWFASFASDVDGCAYYLRALAGGTKAKGPRAVLLRGGTPEELAGAMYAGSGTIDRPVMGYFTGFHPKTSDGSGQRKNVADYAKGLRKHYGPIRAALA